MNFSVQYQNRSILIFELQNTKNEIIMVQGSSDRKIKLKKT